MWFMNACVCVDSDYSTVCCLLKANRLLQEILKLNVQQGIIENILSHK